MKRTNITILSVILMLVAGWCLIVPAAGLADCPDDIVAYWKLDEVSGPTYADFIGDHDGTGNVDPAAVALGKVNGAQLFGVNTGIDVPASKAFNWSATESFSVELWVKTDVTPTANKILVGRGQAAADNVFWWVGLNQNDGKPVFLIRGGR